MEKDLKVVSTAEKVFITAGVVAAMAGFYIVGFIRGQDYAIRTLEITSTSQE
ncbi:MAG: hypothetical protein ABWY25_09685 [Paenisporosarcina sp.]